MAGNGHHCRSGDRTNLLSSQVKAPPHFFKIIRSSVVPRQKLRIPKKFISQYGKNLGNRGFLRVPSGAVWTVELVTSNGDVWMCSGWKEFAKFYSLCFGHLLVFRYDGSYNFDVFIFDKSASEIEYPVSANHGEETNVNGNGNFKIPKTEAIEIDDSVETLGDIPCATYSTGREEMYKRPRRDDIEKFGIQTNQKTRQASYCRENIEKDISIEILDDSLVPDFPVSDQERANKKSRTENNFNMLDFSPDIQSKGVKLPNQKKNVKLEIETEEYPGGTSIEQSRHRSRTPAKMQSVTANMNSTALERAQNFKAKNPFFVVQMQPSYITQSLEIPRSFVKNYLRNNQKNIILQISDGTTWSARCYTQTMKGRCRLGWASFVLDNNLKVGDACVFELVSKSIEPKLNVIIFRK
ncbi:hypothetical protein Vadar_013187 [Vaccinium darrowii]|uniref:Uncharacterized protein n=1 Tax=Vaccinium darrowii TaxID=229202 RepID=A0ACB7YEQ0_9ERIC|nr:hypothetical protein Vadar_013187 [Vaccinium darrowii]